MCILARCSRLVAYLEIDDSDFSSWCTQNFQKGGFNGKRERRNTVVISIIEPTIEIEEEEAGVVCRICDGGVSKRDLLEHSKICSSASILIRNFCEYTERLDRTAQHIKSLLFSNPPSCTERSPQILFRNTNLQRYY